MKRALLALALAIPAARAAGAPADITITVTPAAEYGVAVGSASFAFTLAVGTPTIPSSPVPVQIVGSQQPVELDVSGSVASSSTPWTLAASSAAAVNVLSVRALFTYASQNTPPAAADFLGPTDCFVSSTPLRAGQAGGSGANNYMNPGADPVTMDNLNVGDSRSLWFRLDAPPASTTARPQTLSVTVTATVNDL